VKAKSGDGEMGGVGERFNGVLSAVYFNCSLLMDSCVMQSAFKLCDVLYKR